MQTKPSKRGRKPMNKELKSYIDEIKFDHDRLMLTKKIALDGYYKIIELLNNQNDIGLDPVEYINHVIEKIKGI